MRHHDDVTYAPGTARAADLTSTQAECEEAASGLVMGEEAREAAKAALVRAAGTDDEHDSASELPGDVADGKRRMARAWRVAKGKFVHGESEEGTDMTGGGTVRSGSEEGMGGHVTTAGSHSTDAVTGLTKGAPVGTGMPRSARATSPDIPSIRANGTRPIDAHASSEGVRHRTRRHHSRKTPVNVSSEMKGESVGSDGRGTAGMSRTSRDAARGTYPKARATRREEASGAKTLSSSGAHTTERAIASVRAARGTSAATATGEAAVAAAPVAVIVLLLVVLLVAVLSILAGGAVDEDQRAGAHLVATVATDEYLEGEARGDYNHKGLKYSAYARGEGGGKDDWSACFVAWCLGRAGFEEAGLAPAYGDVDSYLTYFRGEPGLGEVHEGGGERYVPVEGDLFVFRASDGTTRFGIVTSSDGNSFEAVEGDVAGGPNGTYDRDPEDGHGGYVACTTRYVGLCDFIHPNYSAEAVANHNQ